MSFAFQYPPEKQPPFVIYIAHEEKTRAGHWRPSAVLGVTSGLRTSGLLNALSREELHSLILLLTFLAPDGRVGAPLLQLAETLSVSHSNARARFKRLTAVRWLEQPIVRATPWGNGVEAFAPAPGFIPVVEEPLEPPHPPKFFVVPREKVIEHSRRTYAKTRAEVEHEIEGLLSKRSDLAPVLPRFSPAHEGLRRELLEVGLLPEQADDLLRHFSESQIRRQLAWLPLRHAHSPVAYLLAAIRENYAAPRLLNHPHPKREGADE